MRLLPCCVPVPVLHPDAGVGLLVRWIHARARSALSAEIGVGNQLNVWKQTDTETGCVRLQVFRKKGMKPYIPDFKLAFDKVRVL